MRIRRNTKRLVKAQERFNAAVSKLFESLGARPGRFYDLELDTPAGLLHLSVHGNWVATRFDDLTLGRAFTESCGRSCNPCSGKWNFHYADSHSPEIVLADLRYWFGLLMEWEPTS
jgi:hypothetical protein